MWFNIKAREKSHDHEILPRGIFSIDDATGQMKVGDGQTAWKDIPARSGLPAVNLVWSNGDGDDTAIYPWYGGSLLVDDQLRQMTISALIPTRNEAGRDAFRPKSLGPGSIFPAHSPVYGLQFLIFAQMIDDPDTLLVGYFEAPQTPGEPVVYPVNEDWAIQDGHDGGGVLSFGNNDGVQTTTTGVIHVSMTVTTVVASS